MAQDTVSTPNTLVQLAWALLLSRFSGKDDVIFGATCSGRVATLEQASRVVGPLINTLPVRVKLSEAATVRCLIEALRRQHLAMRPFQQTGLGKIKAGSTLARSARLFQTIVVFENQRFYSVLQHQDHRWRGHQLWSRSQSNTPLALAAYFQDGALVLDLEYDLGLYTEAAARRLLSDYGRLLTGIRRSIDRLSTCPCSTLRCAQLTFGEAEREHLRGGPSAIERIIERASLVPGATAVKDLGGSEISYAELERRVLRLAGVLRANKVAPGVMVGVLFSRSIDAVVSLLAVHAARGVFVPLDPAESQPRLEFMVRDSGVKLVLVNRETRGRSKSAMSSTSTVLQSRQHGTRRVRLPFPRLRVPPTSSTRQDRPASPRAYVCPTERWRITSRRRSSDMRSVRKTGCCSSRH